MSTTATPGSTFLSNSSSKHIFQRELTKTASTLFEKRPTRQSIIEAVNNMESQVEKAIVESENPIDIEHAEEVILNDDERGFWINKEETANWKGPIPIEDYKLNEDPNPIVVKKKPSEKLKYKQEVHIKYLKPPTPKPAEIIVVQEPDKQLPPAPPLVIRTAPSPVPTPEPIIIREAPPPEPTPTRKVIIVPGKVLPPPARKIIYEKLPEAPQKPQKVIIERWLKPKPPKTKIIYCKQFEQPCYQPPPPPCETYVETCQPCQPCQPCQQYGQFETSVPIYDTFNHNYNHSFVQNHSQTHLLNHNHHHHHHHHNHNIQTSTTSHYTTESAYTTKRREYVYDIFL